MSNITYKGYITHRPNQFVTWYITESNVIMTSGRTQSVEQARKEIANYANDRNHYGHQISCTIETVNLDN